MTAYFVDQSELLKVLVECLGDYCKRTGARLDDEAASAALRAALGGLRGRISREAAGALELQAEEQMRSWNPCQPR
jgi:hypothetical protein